MNKIHRLLPALLLMAVLGQSCGGENRDSAAFQAEPTTEMMEESFAPKSQDGAPVDDSSEAPAALPQDRKLIKDGTLAWETMDRDSTRQAILNTLGRYGAYVSMDQENRRYSAEATEMVIRVPVGNFDALVASISQGVVKFQERTISTQDVTDRYVDMEARLRTQKELESRYLDLLKRAGTMKEMLEVEQALADVRTTIERMEGQLRLLDNQTQLSTLRLTFYEEAEPIDVDPDEENRMVEALHDGWEILYSLIVGLITLWPLLAIAVIIILLIRQIRKRRNSQK